MLLQTNSYIVPKEKRAEHTRLVARFKQILTRLGCEHFEAYEQVGSNWAGETTGRFVQIMRFRDRKQQQSVQAAERSDPAAQALIKEFCELINFPYQQQQGLFAVGFYSSLVTAGATRVPPSAPTPPNRTAPSNSTTQDNGEPIDASESSDAPIHPIDQQPRKSEEHPDTSTPDESDSDQHVKA